MYTMRKINVSIFIWILFFLVLIFSSFIFYQYWKISKVQKTQTRVWNEKSTQIIEESDIPTVLSMGQIKDYEFIENENSQDTNTELYLTFISKEDLIRSKVDLFVIYGRTPGIFFSIENITKTQKEQVIEVLNDALLGPPNVDSSYLSLSSLQNIDQAEKCQSNFVDFEKMDSWCSFNPNAKSYSKEELLSLVETYSDKDIQNYVINKKTDFSKFLDVEGNIIASLQVNYPIDEYLND